MGNINIDKIEDTMGFLADSEASQLFAGIDYALKNGRHIQRRVSEEDMFRFISRNFDSMQQFYRKFYGISLESGGESIQKYYFLEFFPASRGNISEENRYFLTAENIILGFLLYKIIYIDGQVGVDTILGLQRLIRQDYEDIKPDLYRILAKTKKINTTKMDDDKLNDSIERAIKEFEKLGWISMQDGHFAPEPSFQRLVRIYSDYINNPESWIKA